MSWATVINYEEEIPALKRSIKRDEEICEDYNKQVATINEKINILKKDNSAVNRGQRLITLASMKNDLIHSYGKMRSSIKAKSERLKKMEDEYAKLWLDQMDLKKTEGESS